MKTARFSLIYLAAVVLIVLNLSASSQLPSLQPSAEELAVYPSYDELVAELQQLSTTYSAIMTLHPCLPERRSSISRLSAQMLSAALEAL